MPAIASDTRLLRACDLVASDMEGNIVITSIEQVEYPGIGGAGH